MFQWHLTFVHTLQCLRDSLGRCLQTECATEWIVADSSSLHVLARISLYCIQINHERIREGAPLRMYHLLSMFSCHYHSSSLNPCRVLQPSARIRTTLPPTGEHLQSFVTKWVWGSFCLMGFKNKLWNRRVEEKRVTQGDTTTQQGIMRRPGRRKRTGSKNIHCLRWSMKVSSSSSVSMVMCVVMIVLLASSLPLLMCSESRTKNAAYYVYEFNSNEVCGSRWLVVRKNLKLTSPSFRFSHRPSTKFWRTTRKTVPVISCEKLTWPLTPRSSSLPQVRSISGKRKRSFLSATMIGPREEWTSTNSRCRFGLRQTCSTGKLLLFHKGCLV